MNPIRIASQPAINQLLRLGAAHLNSLHLLVVLIGILNLFLTGPLEAARPTTPSAPSNLSAAAVSSSQINLSWQDNSGNESGFIVQRAPSSTGPWMQIATTSASVTSYANSGLSAGTVCFYRVCAYNSRGSSSYSAIAGATTLPGSCTYTLSASSASVVAGSTGGSVNVTAGTGCGWTATTVYAWIHTASTGSGSGTASFTVDANTSTSPRSGTLSVQGQTFTINQAGAACTYALSANGTSVVAGGGSGGVNVTAGTGCGWTATTVYAWIHTGSSGSGNGSVSFTVDANTSTSPRSGTISVQGQTFTINQAGAACTYALSASSASVGASSGSGGVNVTALSGCNWTATTSYTWIHTGSSGSGSGSVSFTVDANTSTSPRSGTISVQGQTFTINQAGAACTYVLSASSASVGASSGSGSVNVTSVAGCLWIATTSDSSWLTCTPVTGNGSGPVTWSVTANTTTSPRSGVLTLAGLSFTVSQAGSADTTPPTVSLTSPTSGATVSSTITLAANATDNTGGSGVSRVEFYCDGATAGTATVSPYSVQFNTSTLPNGSHSLYCRAYDGAGNSTPSTTVSVTVNNLASTGDCVWAKRYGGTTSQDTVVPLAVAVDERDSSVVMAGFFLGSSDFGKGTLTSAGMRDIFVAKYAADGTPVWAKRLGGTYHDEANGVAIDPITGDVVVVGDFSSAAVDFGGVPLSSKGAADIFVVRYAANGTFKWARSFGDASGDMARGVAIDGADGAAIFTGEFHGAVDFGRGSIASAGAQDAFLAKIDAAGNTLWAKALASTADEDGCAVAVDGSGGIAVTGWTYGSLNLTGVPLVGTGLFVAKYSPLGDCRWAKIFSGGTPSSIAVDDSGNIALTGSFLGSIGFPPLSPMLNSGAMDIFLAKLDSNGNGLWSNRMGNGSTGGGDAPAVTSVAVNGSGDVLLTGQVKGAVDFGPFLAGTADSYYDVFVAKYSAAAGTLQWVKRTLGVGSDCGQAMAVKPNGDAVVAGYFYSSADFGCGPLSNPSYQNAAFLVELGP